MSDKTSLRAVMAGLLSRASELLARCEADLKWLAMHTDATTATETPELLGDIAQFQIDSENAATEALAHPAPPATAGGEWVPTADDASGWLERNELDGRMTTSDALTAIGDARSMHMLAAAPEARPAAQGEPAFREFLGQLVRMEWVAWACEQPNPKASWLQPWTQLTEPEREVDRRIGERIYRMATDALHAPADRAPGEVDFFEVQRVADELGIDYNKTCALIRRLAARAPSAQGECCANAGTYACTCNAYTSAPAGDGDALLALAARWDEEATHHCDDTMCHANGAKLTCASDLRGFLAARGRTAGG